MRSTPPGSHRFSIRQAHPSGSGKRIGGSAPRLPRWMECSRGSSCSPDDVDAASAFYRRVFGLTAQAVELAGRPWVSLHAGRGTNADAVAGVVGKLSAETPNHWNVYFACADIDDTARRAVELGGSVPFGAAPTPIGPMAGIMDPDGARFSLWGSVTTSG